MIDNESTPTVSALQVQTAIAEDKNSVALQFAIDGKTVWIAATDTPSLDALIEALGRARSQMLQPVPNEISGGTHPLSEYDPRWYALPDSQNRFVTLWIRHSGFGWSGYGFSRHEAANIAKWLRRLPVITTPQEKLDSLPRTASSISCDAFLVTTTGLGFYYYGKDEKRIGPNPFEQVEFDSDRAAGIVAGAIAERRLEEALRSRLRSDQPKISQNLFRPSGALGPFSTKIDLAYLLGALSDVAYKDLTNLKDIRNDFAHKLELDSFDGASIRDRCKNFILIDRHVGPIPTMPTEGVSPEIKPDSTHPHLGYLGLPDFEQKLADPRFRYIMTAQLISSALGMGADDPAQPFPLV